jgi:hypothetical protein
MLRKRLEEMTQVEDVTQHPALLMEISQSLPNTIVFLDSPYRLRRYTCGMHVFGFAEEPEYAAIAERGFNRVFAGGAFVHWLIENCLLDELSSSDVKDGDLVIYFNGEGRFKHAGLICGMDRVVSKWGTGHLVRHGLLEVPESYGSTLRFFKKLTYEEAYAYFRRFAAENGMLFAEAR